MKMTTDFRRVYATAIRSGSATSRRRLVLKGKFEPLGVFV